MKKKLLFLFNPLAGRAMIREHLLTIIDTFVKAGYEVTVQTTQYSNELPGLIAQQAANYDLLVTSGGDGTLNESINGLIANHIDIPFGYIAAGTVNDFATTLNLSKNMPTAAADIVNGQPFLCDVGRFQNKCFAYVAAFGAFTEVSYQTAQGTKNTLGSAAYVLEAISRLATIKSYRMRFEYDGQVIEDEFLYGMASNSISVGGMPLNKKRAVSMNDGLLEILLVKKPTFPFDAIAFANALQCTEDNSPYYYAFKTNFLRATCLSEDIAPWTLDGEFGGADRENEIGVFPQTLKILVPRSMEDLSV